MRKTRAKLTEAGWREIFGIRCRGKRGEHLSPGDQRLCERALAEDRARYKRMDADVFDATVPFGSCARVGREPEVPAPTELDSVCGSCGHQLGVHYLIRAGAPACSECDHCPGFSPSGPES